MLAGLPLPRGHGAAKALWPLHELNDRLRLDDLVLRGVEIILAAKPSAVEAVEDLRGPVRTPTTASSLVNRRDGPQSKTTDEFSISSGSGSSSGRSKSCRRTDPKKVKPPCEKTCQMTLVGGEPSALQGRFRLAVSRNRLAS